MPVQTTAKNFLFPDGCQVYIKESGAATYTDCGAIISTVSNSLTYDTNQVETSNAGTTDQQINNMKIEGGFTLVNWDLSVLTKLSGELFTLTNTAAIANTDAPDQTIAANWEDNVLYDLVLETSATDDTELKLDSAPVFTDIVLNHGTPETLVEDTDYYIVANSNAASGWSIGFMSANMGSSTPTAFTITIDFGSNVPRARATINVGASTATLKASAMRFLHTDEDSKTYQLDLYSVDSQSGAFQINFKGANEDGLQELPITFKAKLDSSRTSGQQLMTFLIDTGAA